MSLNQQSSILKFAKLIEEETGIVFQEHNLFQLKSRLEDLGKSEGIATIDEMLTKFQNRVEASFRRKLTDLVTNNETSFFRDPAFFKSVKTVVKELVQTSRPLELKIWSAASSTGQEALSIAMTLHELSQEMSIPSFKIIGSDLSTKALAKATAGNYTDFELRRGLSDERKAKYFTKVGNDWQARAFIKDRVQFQFNNLLTNTVTDQFDVIFCRNVLIYQNVERKKLIVQSLVRQLKPEGSLFLGVGETLLGVNNALEFVTVEGAPVYRPPRAQLQKTA